MTNGLNQQITVEESTSIQWAKHCHQGSQSKLQLDSALSLKVPVMTAADGIHKYSFHCFSEKIRHDVSSESSARQRIHRKNQALFSSKDKN